MLCAGLPVWQPLGWPHQLHTAGSDHWIWTLVHDQRSTNVPQKSDFPSLTITQMSYKTCGINYQGNMNLYYTLICCVHCSSNWWYKNLYPEGVASISFLVCVCTISSSDPFRGALITHCTHFPHTMPVLFDYLVHRKHCSYFASKPHY